MVNFLPAGLCEILRALPPFMIALSGGLDSRFICKTAKLLGCDFVAVHAFGPHVPEAETSWTKIWAKKNGIRLELIKFDPLKEKLVRENGPRRCYFCKRALFSLICANGKPVLDGTHAGDMKKYRPGLEALRELSVISPLAQAGLLKNDIRYLAEKIGMDRCSQKARPCLLTRFAYGLEPDYEILARVEAAEKELEKIAGKADFRLRLLPRPLLQLADHGPIDEDKAREVLRRYAFGNCEIMRSADVSGYFDNQSIL